MMKATAQGRVVRFTPFRNFNFERTFQTIAGGQFSPVSGIPTLFNYDSKAIAAIIIIRGVFKKFAAQPRRKTNFMTKRDVRGVTLLKRPLTQPLANRSSCFAQAVGCCKNVSIFVERSDARRGAVIPFVVLQKKVARVIHEYLLATPGEHYLP